MSEARLRTVVSLAVGLFLVFPFLVVLGDGGFLRVPFEKQWFEVFAISTAQAALSALLALICGITGGMGLLALAPKLGNPRWARALEFAALAPNAAPVFLFILASMKYMPWARGLTGVVAVHALLNTGLVAVAFSRLARAKLGRLAEVSWVGGASQLRFLTRVALPVLAPDLAQLFLFVFAICFASFSVPLVIGGVHATTVEVLIYQKLRLDSDWSRAGQLALLQSLSVLALSWALSRGRAARVEDSEARAVPLLGWLPGVTLALGPSVLLVAGLLDTNVEGIRQAFEVRRFSEELPSLIFASFLTAAGAGVVMMALLFAIAYVRPSGAFRRALVGYVAPSAALTGYALLVVWRTLGPATYCKIALGVALISLPAFLRWQWDGLLSGLEGQVDTARTLGAGPNLIFRKVVLPQLLRAGAFAGGVTSLWTWGDFALSSVIAERSVTVAMAARGMMDSYRLDAATFMAWVMVLGGVATAAIFIGAGNVLGTRTQT